MAGTECWACLTAVATLRAGLGTTGDPSGCCRNCHALACGHHGQRDASVPEFVCVECDPALLAASAAAIAGPAVGPAPGGSGSAAAMTLLRELDRTGRAHDTAERREGAPHFRSLHDFIARRPNYGHDVLGQLADAPEPPRRALDILGLDAIGRVPEAARMLVGAAMLVQLMALPEHSVAPVLREVAAALALAR